MKRRSSRIFPHAFRKHTGFVVLSLGILFNKQIGCNKSRLSTLDYSVAGLLAGSSTTIPKCRSAPVPSLWALHMCVKDVRLPSIFIQTHNDANTRYFTFQPVLQSVSSHTFDERAVSQLFNTSRRSGSGTALSSFRPPDVWREQLEGVREMRRLRDAAVDTAGANALKNSSVGSPSEVRFQVRGWAGAKSTCSWIYTTPRTSYGTAYNLCSQRCNRAYFCGFMYNSIGQSHSSTSK